MKKYVHIGYPKNISTTLQVDYFSKHAEIYHLGTGIHHNTGYIDHKTSAYFENIFFYSNQIMYESLKKDILSHINKHYKIFEKSGKNIFGMSLEHISLSFTPADIDIYLKFNRVRDIFGKNVKIIAIIRNQADLIKSLYRESIRVGYSKNFNDYIAFLYLYQNYSYFHEIAYDNVYEILTRFFNKDNIYFLPIEYFRTKDGSLIQGSDQNYLIVEELNSILGLSNIKMDLHYNNETLNKKELFQKLEFNKKYPHELSNKTYEPVQKHRLKDYFKIILDSDVQNIYEDVKIKRLGIEMAKDIAKKDSREVNYHADKKNLFRIKEYYEKSNTKLSQKYGVTLPNEYYNLIF